MGYDTIDCDCSCPDDMSVIRQRSELQGCAAQDEQYEIIDFVVRGYVEAISSYTVAGHNDHFCIRSLPRLR